MNEMLADRAHIKQLQKGKSVIVRTKKYPKFRPGKFELFNHFDETDCVVAIVRRHVLFFWYWVLIPAT
jgi:hypothetical protein